MTSLMKMRWRDYSVMFLHRLETMKDEKRLESDRICAGLRPAEFNSITQGKMRFNILVWIDSCIPIVIPGDNLLDVANLPVQKQVTP